MSLASRFRSTSVDSYGTLILADLESARGPATPDARLLGLTSLKPATRTTSRTHSRGVRDYLRSPARTARKEYQSRRRGVLDDGGGQADAIIVADLAALTVPLGVSSSAATDQVQESAPS